MPGLQLVQLVKTVQALAQKLGCKFEALYYSLGEYDGFVILEAPDETTVTAFVLAAMAPGHLRVTKTTVLRTDVQNTGSPARSAYWPSPMNVGDGARSRL